MLQDMVRWTPGCALWMVLACEASPAAVAEAPVVTAQAATPSPQEDMQPGGGESSQSEATANRHIIVEVDVSFEIAAVESFEAQLEGLVEATGGYISDASRSGRVGSARRANWVVRVPSAVHTSFVEQLGQRAELLSMSKTSHDVTMEIVDVEARLKSRRAEETRLLELLQSRAGTLEDVLAIEKELTRLRGDIEAAEGRRRVLTHQVEMATIRIEAYERTVYEPAVAKTLGEKAARTLGRSWEGLLDALEGLLLVVVGLLPWLPFIGILVALGVYARRRRRRAAELARRLQEARHGEGSSGVSGPPVGHGSATAPPRERRT